MLALWKVFEVDPLGVEPLSPGLKRSNLGLDLLVFNDLASLSVN